jgi:hypothetical protein
MILRGCEDGCPMTNVGHDGELDRFLIKNVRNDGEEKIPDD